MEFGIDKKELTPTLDANAVNHFSAKRCVLKCDVIIMPQTTENTHTASNLGQEMTAKIVRDVKAEAKKV